MADKVFIALQNNEEARPIIEAILEDNPGCDRQLHAGHGKD